MSVARSDPTLGRDDLALLEETAAACAAVRREVSRVVVGQEQAVTLLLTSVLAQGHTLLVGVPGLAKTLLVRTLAAALGWSFKRIQFTPDMMPADVIGVELLEDEPATGARRMRFHPGPIFANLVLADEINRTPPKTQAALLEAMQELQVTSLGATHALHRPFIVLATQNPIEQEGTYPLPEAQLDRFMFSLRMDYPSVAEEERIVAADPPVDVAPVLHAARALAMQDLVRRMPASDFAVRHAVALTRATRPTDASASDFVRRHVEWGAGPRAAQHLLLAGKALAALEAQPTVSLRHLRQAAPFVLRHRVLPNFTAAGEGLDAAAVVEHVLRHTPEPA